MLCLMLSFHAAVAQEDTSRKWQVNVETGPGRALTTFHSSRNSTSDDIYDEIWTVEVSANRKLGKHLLLGVGTGMWGKVGGTDGPIIKSQHTDLIPLFAEVTWKGNEEKNLKPFITLKGGPAFSVKNGPNYGIFGAQGGVAIQLGRTVDFRVALDINRALLRVNGFENFRHQTYVGAKAGFTFYFNKKKKTTPSPIIEKETIYRDVPREVEKIREVERVVEKITKEFTPVPVFFKLDDIKILDREMVTIQYLARLMKANPDMKFVVNGYADEVTGTVKRNEWLANNRAENVYKALLKEGVPATQISSKIGHGGVGNLFLDNNELSRCVIIDIVK